MGTEGKSRKMRMMRLIDAGKLTEAIVDAGQANEGNRYKISDVWELNYAEIRAVINAQPTVDAEPVKHGQWELVSQGVWGGYFVCTRCNHRALLSVEDGTEELSPFCPNCGARMDG